MQTFKPLPKTLLAVLAAVTLAACSPYDRGRGAAAGMGSPIAQAKVRGAGAARAAAAPDPAGILAPRLPAAEFAPAEADVLYDNDTFQAMEALVAKAQKSIRIDYYIFGGPTAERLATTLIAKHQAGVDVRVLLDGALGKIPEMQKQGKQVLARLRAAGVPVAFHATKAIPPKTGGTTIDHNKYFVVDGAEALVGSMNLAQKFYNYHDLMIQVRGPVAADLAAQHEFDWYQAQHPEAAAPRQLVQAAPASVAPLPPGGPGQVRLVGTGLGRKTGVQALLPLLERATRSIHVQMHELGPGPVLDALIAARGRGVAVQLLLDPGVVDSFVPIVRRAPRGIVNAVATAMLLDAKMDVRVFKVDDTLTTAHMKSGVIDGEVLFAGSINWTRGGFEAVAETNLEIHGGRAPQQAEAMFQRDWQTRSVPAERPSVLALQLCKLYQATGP